MINLNQGRLTIDAINAPRETIRTFLKRHMPLPIPEGDKNMLNRKFNMTMTLLHRSVKELKYDIVDLLLTMEILLTISLQDRVSSAFLPTTTPSLSISRLSLVFCTLIILVNTR